MMAVLRRVIFIVFWVAASAAYGVDSLEIKAHIPWGWISDFEFYHDGIFIAPDGGGISYYTIDDSFNLHYRYTIDPGGFHTLSQFTISDSFLYALDGSPIHTSGTPVFFVYAVTESTYTYLAGLEPSGTIWANFDPIIYSGGNIFYHKYPGDYFRIDVTDPSDPQLTGKLRNTSDVCLSMIPYQDTLLITTRQQGTAHLYNFRVIKTNAPDTLISIGVYGNRPSYTADLVNIGSILFTAHLDGFVVYDITDLQNPEEIYFYPTTWGRCLARVNNYIFMGGNDGWYVFKYVNPDSILLDEYKSNDRRVLRMRLRLDQKELWCFVDGGALGGLVVFDISEYVGIKGETGQVSEAHHQVLKNYPNPFRGVTFISYSLKEPGPVELTIYSCTGEKMKTLVSGFQEAGNHGVCWNAKDFPSGVYFYRLKIPKSERMGKALLVR